MSVWNKLYCKRLWQNIRFPNGHVAEDRATTFKIIDNCERIYILDESLYLHRIRPGSITQTASIQKIRDKVLAFDQLQEFVEKNTPKVFDNRQLKKSRKEHINCLMSSYADSLIQAHNSSDIYSNELRKRIVTPQNKEEIKECSIKMRAAFLMICFCPHLLKLLYSSYYPINRLLNRITGR